MIKLPMGSSSSTSALNYKNLSLIREPIRQAYPKSIFYVNILYDIGGHCAMNVLQVTVNWQHVAMR